MTVELTCHGSVASRHALSYPDDVNAGCSTRHIQAAVSNRKAIEAMPNAVKNWCHLLTLYDLDLRRECEWMREELDGESEEAAASLGANRWQTFWRVVLPSVLPALLTGFALALARALGEYGSVVFIAGNMPLTTEITSLLIITKLEQYDYAGAAAIAVVMLAASFLILLAINLLQWWAGQARRGA